MPLFVLLFFRQNTNVQYTNECVHRSSAYARRIGVLFVSAKEPFQTKEPSSHGKTRRKTPFASSYPGVNWLPRHTTMAHRMLTTSSKHAFDFFMFISGKQLSFPLARIRPEGQT